MKNFLSFIVLLISLTSFSQDINVTLKEASNLERALKEEQAFEKYKAVLAADGNNVIALIKGAELSAAIGGRQKDKKAKKPFFEAAKAYADKVISIASDNADANYIMSLTSTKMAEVETENKKLAAFVRDAKLYADKVLVINPEHARANYAEGKWHFEMMQTSWVKKTVAKTLLGGLPEATIEDAIKYMEKCKLLDQYFVVNYLDLAKAYKYYNRPTKAIEVLQKLVKLPNRTADDANLKAEGKKLLDEML
jgi:tetratricopeptide (TPR) repeat protein